MNNIKIKLKIFFLILTAASVPMWGENISVSQLDTSGMFISSTIDCYVRITDSDGQPVELADPESSIKMGQLEDKKTVPLTVLGIEKNSESSEGVTFLLLIDNSGSMYEPAEGDPETERITAALRAASAFFSSLDPEKDRGGIAVFNRDFRLLSEPGENFNSSAGLLSTINKPEKEESFTELYYTVAKAAGELGKRAGRKAIILLSDGENYPYFSNTGKEHPVLGSRNYLPEQASEALSENEVTLYAVNFSREKDIPLAGLAVSSGGRVFDASDESELTGVYENIRKSITGEYRIKVRVPVSLSKTPSIEAVLDEEHRDSMTYSTALIFGSGHVESVKPAVILLIAGFAAWAALFFIRLEKEAVHAELTQLMAGKGRGKALEKTILLSSPNTVIGGSGSADYTITGIPEIKDSHATIVRDEKTESFTLVSSQEVRVNNRPVRKKVLNPGDVINIEGATMVFDAPEKTEDK